MEGQVTDVEQEVIITNNNLLFQFSGHNNDLLVLKQWKGALNRIMPSLLGLLKNNDQGLGALASHAGVFSGARFSSLGRDEKRAPLKTPAWEAIGAQVLSYIAKP